MADPEDLYLQFLISLAELEVLQNAVEIEGSNTRWRGQQREGGPIDLETLQGEAWKTYFRFSREEIHRLVKCLRIPEVVKCDNRIQEDRVTALCMLLARLSWPNRLSDLHLKFGWKPERISRIINTLLQFLYNTWKHLLHFDAVRLTPEKLVTFTVAIQQRGAPLDSCFGFIDGTLRKIARPEYGQESVYNGWKRYHCLKYQAIVTPDGIIIHLYGPMEGTKHDAAVWNESNMVDTLEQYAHAPDGRDLHIYGDPAYGIGGHLITPFQGAAVTRDERLWNNSMSKVRIVVEWCFKEVLQLFPFLDFSRSQQALLSPVGIQYPVAVLLHNAHVCLHRPQITQYFSRQLAEEDNIEILEDEIPDLIEPPTLEEYFH